MCFHRTWGWVTATPWKFSVTVDTAERLFSWSELWACSADWQRNTSFANKFHKCQMRVGGRDSTSHLQQSLLIIVSPFFLKYSFLTSWIRETTLTCKTQCNTLITCVDLKSPTTPMIMQLVVSLCSAMQTYPLKPNRYRTFKTDTDIWWFLN